MRDEEGDHFHYSGDTNPTQPSAETQQEARDDIMQQFVTYMERALQEPDPWKAIRIMANGEQICDIYTSGGFDMLQGFQSELRRDLWKVWRMTRRRFIKAALLSPPHEFPLYFADMRNPELHLDGRDALADFKAVCKHLDRGKPLFAGLRRRA